MTILKNEYPSRLPVVFLVCLLVLGLAVSSASALPNFPKEISKDGVKYALVAYGSNDIGKGFGTPSGLGAAWGAASKLAKVGEKPWDYPPEVFDLLALDAERASELARLKFGKNLDAAYSAGIAAAKAGAPSVNSFADAYKPFMDALSAMKTNPDPLVARLAKHYEAEILKATTSPAFSGNAGKTIVEVFSKGSRTSKTYPRILATFVEVAETDPARDLETFTKYAEGKLADISAKMTAKQAALTSNGFTVAIDGLQGARVSVGTEVVAESLRLPGVATIDDVTAIANADDVLRTADAVKKLKALNATIAKNFNNVARFFEEYKRSSGSAKAAASTKLQVAIDALNAELGSAGIASRLSFEFDAAAGTINAIERIGAGTKKILSTSAEFMEYIRVSKPGVSSSGGLLAWVAGKAKGAVSYVKASSAGKPLWWVGGKLAEGGQFVASHTPSVVKGVLKVGGKTAVYGFKTVGKALQFTVDLAVLIPVTVFRGITIGYCTSIAGNDTVGDAHFGYGRIFDVEGTDEPVEGPWLLFDISSNFSPVLTCVDQAYHNQQNPLPVRMFGWLLDFVDLSGLVQDVSTGVYSLFDSTEYKTCDVALYFAGTPSTTEIQKLPVGCEEGQNPVFAKTFTDKIGTGDYLAYGRIGTGRGAAEIISDKAHLREGSYRALNFCSDQLDVVAGLTAASSAATEDDSAKWTYWTECIESSGFVVDMAKFSTGISTPSDSGFSVISVNGQRWTASTDTQSFDLSDSSEKIVLETKNRNNRGFVVSVSTELDGKNYDYQLLFPATDPAISGDTLALSELEVLRESDHAVFSVSSFAKMHGAAELYLRPATIESDTVVEDFSSEGKTIQIQFKEIVQPAEEGLLFSQILKASDETKDLAIIHSKSASVLAFEPFVLKLDGIQDNKNSSLLMAVSGSSSDSCKNAIDLANNPEILDDMRGKSFVYVAVTDAVYAGAAIKGAAKYVWGEAATAWKDFLTAVHDASAAGSTGTDSLTVPGAPALADSRFLNSNPGLQTVYLGSVNSLVYADFKGKSLWKIQSILNSKRADAGLVDGKPVRFIACQVKTESGKFVSLGSSSEAVLDVRFGTPKCSSLLECLSQLDHSIVSTLFGWTGG